MSKAKKSSSDKERKKLNKLLKKLNKINKKVKKIRGKDNDDSSSVNSENSVELLNDETKIGEVPETELTEQNLGENSSINNEEIMDEDWINIVGEDPTENSAIQMDIKPDLLKRWKYFCSEGIKKEEYDSLIKKYECFKELEAPKLNPQISATMKDVAIVRDNHMLEIQTLASTALSVVGSLITSIYENKDEGLDLAGVLTSLCDTGKFLSAIVHKQSNSRKAFIEPGLTKETKAILKDIKVDEFLYGKELGEKIKEAKAINKLGENLKVQPAKSNPQAPKKFPLNGRTPFPRRPHMNNTGYMNFGGRQRQRVPFKNKQQFVNHRYQNPQRPKVPPPKQDKKE